MAKKCPPGFICFENITLIFILIILFCFLYLVFNSLSNKSKNSSPSENKIIITRVQNPPTLLNTNIPVSINTQRGDFTYQQVGILTRVNGPNLILPLYGRQINTSRSKWQYYSMNDSNNIVKLPISVNGKSGSDEYGVDELYSNDTVYVEGYDDVFKATIYKNNNYYYSPF